MENLILTDQSQALFALGVVASMFLLFSRRKLPNGGRRDFWRCCFAHQRGAAL